MTFTELQRRYPRFEWHYSVDVGFWAKARHPLYDHIPPWYLSFYEGVSPADALRELDVVHDALPRLECQFLTLPSHAIRVRVHPPPFRW